MIVDRIERRIGAKRGDRTDHRRAVVSRDEYLITDSDTTSLQGQLDCGAAVCRKGHRADIEDRRTRSARARHQRGGPGNGPRGKGSLPASANRRTLTHQVDRFHVVEPFVIRPQVRVGVAMPGGTQPRDTVVPHQTTGLAAAPSSQLHWQRSAAQRADTRSCGNSRKRIETGRGQLRQAQIDSCASRMA